MSRIIAPTRTVLTALIMFAFGWCASGYYTYMTAFAVQPISIEEVR